VSDLTKSLRLSISPPESASLNHIMISPSHYTSSHMPFHAPYVLYPQSEHSPLTHTTFKFSKRLLPNPANTPALVPLSINYALHAAIQEPNKQTRSPRTYLSSAKLCGVWTGQGWKASSESLNVMRFDFPIGILMCWVQFSWWASESGCEPM
jgi:hypothetical protein